MNLFPLYAIVDQQTAERFGWTVPDLARSCLSGGARLLQLRVTSATSTQFLSWCDQVVEMARSYDAQVLVNNRVDLALLSGADGVHIGQTDIDVGGVREMMRASSIVGLATHTGEEVAAADSEDVSYIAVGPVYPTRTKAGKYTTVGLELVKHASLVQPRPVVAIGGITLDRAADVVSAGASAVAVVSDLLVDNNPGRRVSDYIDRLIGLVK